MIVSKDEPFNKSSVYVAALLLDAFKRKGITKMSIFDAMQELKKHKIDKYRQVFSGLLLLYVTDIIDFQEPFLYIKND